MLSTVFEHKQKNVRARDVVECFNIFLIAGNNPGVLYKTLLYAGRSISMRAGLASLQFDWSKAGLSMDLPAFVYFHMKTSLKFLSRQGKCRAAFMWLQIFLGSNHAERTLQGSCFV